ncbi:MAG: group II intron reverse transcriptase/maturase [Polyangia bacterium]
MREPHIEGPATHDDPESCGCIRKGAVEALTGARLGRVWSREIKDFGVPTLLSEAEGHTPATDRREVVSDPARSKTPSTSGIFLRENREIPAPPDGQGPAGPPRKGCGRTPRMHGAGKSDRPIVPTNEPNKAALAAAEAREGRGRAQGNTLQQNAPRTQSRTSAQSALERVRQAAKRDKEMKFTALYHHLSRERLRDSFFALQKQAAAGIDGLGWEQYRSHLEENLQALHDRLHKGAYKAQPTRRVLIAKADGGHRPLGIAALEDKIVQRAVVEVLSAIYETDFLGFSYGFRPRRSAHQALDALSVGIQRKKVNWVLDADLRDFFGSLNHAWLMKFLQHRIADKRILRLIHKWLKAGVLTERGVEAVEQGSVQGAVISPLLANVYLHYAFDQWVHRWRRREARGEVIVVRYADDFVLGFEHRDEAERFQKEQSERLAKFSLELHADKTRLIEFGRYAAPRRTKRGQGKPETFCFLGFVHICGRSPRGTFRVLRRTMRKRLAAKLQEVKTELMRRRHQRLPEQGQWLASVIRGHCGYYAVPGNFDAVAAFRTQAIRHWHRALRRRSQRSRVDWRRLSRLAARYIPPVRTVHPRPERRFDERTRGKSPVR